jgi:cell fate regulator YaaT (PSP1 superfamily)
MQDNNENHSEETKSEEINTAKSNDIEVREDVTEKPASTSNESSSSPEKDTKFKDGDLLTFVRVRFPGNSKSFPFITGNKRYDYGQKVVAMSDRGMTVGYVNSFPYELKFNKSMLPIKGISKLADQEDIDHQQENIDKEKEAENKCKHLIEKFKLDMTITHVEFIQFGKKAVFYFNAPARVDFRELVRELVADLKMRIELRQISVRDRVAALGAIGPCGLQTCCSSFLKKYGNVNIKMPKNQNLALIPSKINGVCGQIKCCMKYEDEVYTEKRQYLPREGKFIKTLNGDLGKVLKLHIFEEQFDMLTDKGQKRRYMRTQYDPKSSNTPKDWQFPNRFNHIVNECSSVIGEKYLPETTSTKEVEVLEDKITQVSPENTETLKSKEVDKEAGLKSNVNKESKDSDRKSQQNRNRNRNRNRNKNYNKDKAASSDNKKEDGQKNRPNKSRFKKPQNKETNANKQSAKKHSYKKKQTSDSDKN